MADRSAAITAADRERLSDAYELRFRGEGGPLTSALFAAYLLGLLGMVYGAVLAHYVFEEWPGLSRIVRDRPVLTVVAVLVLIVLLAVGAFRTGRTRGPVLPEPGHLEFVVATDLPRRLTLRDAWRGSQLTVLAACLCLGVAVPAGYALSGGSGTAIAVGAVLGLLAALLISQAWLRGQAYGHTDIRAGSSWAVVTGLPLQELLRQSLMSEAVTSSLIVGDTRRARAQAFPVRLRRRPARIPVAGRWLTVCAADVTGLLRTGGSAAVWLLAEVAALVLLGSRVVLDSDSPLLLPVLALAAHLAATGLTRGLQSHAASAGDPSLLGLSPVHEALLHLAPLAVVQLVVVTGSGLLTGVGGDAGGYGVFAAATLAGGQLLYAHKGPPPAGLLISGPGRGVGLLWAMHPALAVLVAGFAATQGPLTALLAGAALAGLGVSRMNSRCAPAHLS